ncbi:MAG: RnfABCDGE type electron transport complex subunit D [bacterium]|nr:RnfABCDGE type electron transport complex subunit D [bacterium]
MADNKFIVKPAPFLKKPTDVKMIMWTVVLALIPTTVWAIYLYRLNAVIVILSTILFTELFEMLFLKIRGSKKVIATSFDGSAFVTGLLLALNLPSSAPWWLCAAGAFVAMLFGKHIFGGLGHNPFNPALIARVFLLLSFPTLMTTWKQGMSVDAMTYATPLGILKTDGIEAVKSMDLWRLFAGLPVSGVGGGSIGEISELAVLIGGLLLIVLRVIPFFIPLVFILTVYVFTWIFNAANPSVYASPMFHMVTGGLFLGAFFMATDMVTTPITPKGKIIFAFGCGLITSLIRLFGAYPEGVSFAILIMETLTPTIDKVTKLKKFGA